MRQGSLATMACAGRGAYVSTWGFAEDEELDEEEENKGESQLADEEARREAIGARRRSA